MSAGLRRVEWGVYCSEKSKPKSFPPDSLLTGTVFAVANLALSWNGKLVRDRSITDGIARRPNIQILILGYTGEYLLVKKCSSLLQGIFFSRHLSEALSNPDVWELAKGTDNELDQHFEENKKRALDHKHIAIRVKSPDFLQKRSIELYESLLSRAHTFAKPFEITEVDGRISDKEYSFDRLELVRLTNVIFQINHDMSAIAENFSLAVRYIYTLEKNKVAEEYQTKSEQFLEKTQLKFLPQHSRIFVAVWDHFQEKMRAEYEKSVAVPHIPLVLVKDMTHGIDRYVPQTFASSKPTKPAVPQPLSVPAAPPLESIDPQPLSEPPALSLEPIEPQPLSVPAAPPITDQPPQPPAPISRWRQVAQFIQALVLFPFTPGGFVALAPATALTAFYMTASWIVAAKVFAVFLGGFLVRSGFENKES